MSDDRARPFADALVQLEDDRDVDRFVAQVFADDIELSRPEADQQTQGRDGARAFWQQYLDQFDEIRSEFSRIVDSDELGLLEWTSRGRLRGGSDITYRGVSVLDFGDDGQVRRFTTYYDTAPFGLIAPKTTS